MPRLKSAYEIFLVLLGIAIAISMWIRENEPGSEIASSVLFIGFMLTIWFYAQHKILASVLVSFVSTALLVKRVAQIPILEAGIMILGIAIVTAAAFGLYTLMVRQFTR